MSFITTFSFLMVLLLVAKGQNISLGTSLTAGGNTSSWVSPSGDFAFGFLPVQAQKNKFLLGIWFNKIEEKTIVWAAKPETNGLVGAGSKIELTTDGFLVLRDRNGAELWKTENNNNIISTTHAALLNNGNFVLAMASSNDFLWQSFENPTDTMLPTQRLRKGLYLTARATETNYFDGRFKLSMQQSGNLELHPIAVPSRNPYNFYWNSNTEGNGSFLLLNKSSGADMILSDGTTLNIIPGALQKSGAYQRATLDLDGVFRLYVYLLKGSSKGSWNFNGHVPPNICTALTNREGSGACGYNAYCTIGDDNRPNCNCPPRYKFMDPSRKDKGCIPEFPLQVCGTNATKTSSQYEMVQLLSIDWPWDDYEWFTSFNEEDCEAKCLEDCFCIAAIYRQGNCWTKKFPLTNGRKDNDDVGMALLKVPTENTTTPSTTSPLELPPVLRPLEKIENKVFLLTGSLLLGISILINSVMAGVFWFYCYRRRMIKHQHQQESDLSMLGTSLQSFTYSELEEVTQGFNEELGRGTFGIVYKGIFGKDTSIPVAVKRLTNIEEEVEREFMNEVRVIAQTHHKNLVRLLGYCNEEGNRLLVFELMSNGSLTNLLFGHSRPNWTQRTEIAQGIARGLHYLHEECEKQIVHCDIKPQNVLLDEFCTPKISDFGLAKLMRIDQTQTNTRIRGTIGYFAPEWFKATGISTKVDVYSFGVMLLEIIFCRKNVKNLHGEGQYVILTNLAFSSYKMGSLDEMLEQDMEAKADMIRLERFVMVGLWCIQQEPTSRPSMKKVAQMLEGGVEVPEPPDPSSPS